MRRISQIETAEDFRVELEREALRDRRWRRRRNVILISLFCAIVVGGFLTGGAARGDLARQVLSSLGNFP